MFDCFKKFCVIFLSLSFISSANAMITKFLPETFFGYSYIKQDSLNRNLWEAMLTAYHNDPANSPYLATIKDCLDKGADPNAKSSGETPLRFLILSCGEFNLRLPIIEIMCDFGASLVNLSDCKTINYVKYNPGVNAFHYAVIRSEGKGIIQTLMTHARFDSYDQNQEQKERKVLAALSVLSGLPKDIRFYTLDQLALIDDIEDAGAYSSNKKLGEKLSSLGYNGSILAQVRKRVTSLKQLLDSKDDKYKQTPSGWVTAFPGLFSDQYKKEIQFMLDKNELQKNWDDFNYGFPDILKLEPDNPVCEMYNNCAKLLEVKK